MNPRRIHDLMRMQFPPLRAELREWKNIIVEGKPSANEIMELFERFIPGDTVLVEVHRTLGGAFLKIDALDFVSENWGKSDIRIADREFSGFVVVAQNGVATGWGRPLQPEALA